MNKTLKVALAAFLAAGVSQAAYASPMGTPETTVGGETIYVEDTGPGSTLQYDIPGHNGLTISGAVGLPLNPTASIPNPGSVRIQGNYYGMPEVNADFGVFGDVSLDTKYYGIFAAGRPGDGPLEISGGLAKLAADADSDTVFGPAFNDFIEDGLEDAFDKSGLAIGVKYLIKGADDNPQGVRVAVGAGYNRALLKNVHAYVVVSKAFGIGRRAITGHLGARYDRFKIEFFGDDDTSSKLSAFAGVEIPIDSRGRFNLVGELQSKNADEDFGGKVPFSLALRYQNENGVAVTAGIQRFGVFAEGGTGVDVDSTQFFVQAGKTF